MLTVLGLATSVVNPRTRRARSDHHLLLQQFAAVRSHRVGARLQRTVAADMAHRCSPDGTHAGSMQHPEAAEQADHEADIVDRAEIGAVLAPER